MHKSKKRKSFMVHGVWCGCGNLGVQLWFYRSFLVVRKFAFENFEYDVEKCVYVKTAVHRVARKN